MTKFLWAGTIDWGMAKIYAFFNRQARIEFPTNPNNDRRNNILMARICARCGETWGNHRYNDDCISKGGGA